MRVYGFRYGPTRGARVFGFRAAPGSVPTVITVTAGALGYAGSSMAVNARTAVAVTAGALRYAGASVVVNARRAIAVTASAYRYAGALVQVIGGGSGGLGGLIRAGAVSLARLFGISLVDKGLGDKLPGYSQ